MTRAAQVAGEDAEAAVGQPLRRWRPYRGRLGHVVQQQQRVLAVAPLRIAQPHPWQCYRPFRALDGWAHLYKDLPKAFVVVSRVVQLQQHVLTVAPLLMLQPQPCMSEEACPHSSSCCVSK